MAFFDPNKKRTTKQFVVLFLLVVFLMETSLEYSILKEIFWLFNQLLNALSSHRKSFLLLLVIIPLHHIIDFPSGFDLFPVVKPSFLLGCEIQEIPGCSMRLPVISEQVKGALDVWHLFRIKTGLVIITGKTDDTVNSLTENVACFEQQETEAANNMPLPCAVPQIWTVAEWNCKFS